MASTSTVFKSAGACSDASLPLLYKDPAATSGTKWVFDALDTSSWPSQAAPSVGNAWKNLVTGSDATFASIAAGWSGGFTFPGATSASISLPAAGKFAATPVSGLFFSVWFKPGVSNQIVGIGGLSDGTTANCQYLILQGNGTFSAGANGLTVPAAYNGVVAGSVYQLAVGYEGDGAGNFTRTFWVNGVQVATGTAAAASMTQPTNATPQLGKLNGLLGPNGTIYRSMLDNLTSGATVAQLVAADYAAGVGRFS